MTVAYAIAWFLLGGIVGAIITAILMWVNVYRRLRELEKLAKVTDTLRTVAKELKVAETVTSATQQLKSIRWNRLWRSKSSG